jgi:hypothetical protein
MRAGVSIKTGFSCGAKISRIDNVHSDVHFAPQLTGDYATRDASCKIP